MPTADRTTPSELAQVRSENTALRQRVKELRSEADQLKTAMAQAQVHRARIMKLRPLPGYLDFTDQVLKRNDELKADVYLAHGTEPLHAAHALQAQHPGALYCDVIETPAYGDRSIRQVWEAPVVSLLDNATLWELQRCDALLTVGVHLASSLLHLGPDVHVIPNMRRYEPVQPGEDLKAELSLPADCTLGVVVSTVTAGFKAILGSLLHLPDTFHIAVLGEVKPAAYRDEMAALAQDLGIADRVHFHGLVPYERLHGLLNSADVGLICLDSSIRNHHLSLPNRVFDCVSAELPFCSPPVFDIAHMVAAHGVGAIVNPSPAAWADGIKSVLSNKEKMRAATRAAYATLCWEAIEPQFQSLFEPGKVRKVTVLGYCDLRENQRSLRMAASLAKIGLEVTFATRVSSMEPWAGATNFRECLIPMLGAK